jgi:hypothetical protein
LNTCLGRDSGVPLIALAPPIPLKPTGQLQESSCE